MATGQAYPSRKSVPSITEVIGRWKGGGAAANCTRAAGEWSAGISSVNYNGATGKYRITFTDVPGQQLVSFCLEVGRATGVTNALKVKVVEGSYSIANKTIDIEICDLATPTGVDLATTDRLYVRLSFASFPPNS